MKRVLSWVVIPLCFLVVCVLATLDQELFVFLLDLFDRSPSIVKIIIVLFGGSFATLLAFAPATYGAVLTQRFSDSICPSKKGLRYIVFGLFVVAFYGWSLIRLFVFKDMLVTLFGAILIILGVVAAKGNK